MERGEEESTKPKKKQNKAGTFTTTSMEEEEDLTKEKKTKKNEEDDDDDEDQRLIANNRRETHQNAPHIRGRDDDSSSPSSSSSVFGVLESATKMVCFGILALFVAKAVYANVVHPLVSLSNADYTLKTVVRDVFYGYEKPPRTVKTAASSVRDIEREKKRLADETRLKRKLEHREKKRKKLHEKLGLNHEEEVENWRRESEKRKKKRSTGSAHGEL